MIAINAMKNSKAQARRSQDGFKGDGSKEDGLDSSGAGDASAGNSSPSSTSLFFHSLPNVSCSLSGHDLAERFSSVPAATHDRALHPALVRRRPGDLDHMSAVLPDLPAGWLRVRALAGVALQRSGSGGYPHWIAARVARVSAASPQRSHLEAGYFLRSLRPDLAFAHADSGWSLPAVVRNRAPGAALVHDG